MANKRMFTMKIVDTDAFLDMPLSTQCLYFHLNMRADDDGFIGNPKRIEKIIGANDDDLKLLIVKRFVILFDDGVIVIKHWRMHNTLSRDRYVETSYTDEKRKLLLKDNGSYSLTGGNPIDDTKLIERSNRQTNKRRKIDEQKTYSDKDIDLDKDLELDLDTELDKDKEKDINDLIVSKDTIRQTDVQRIIDEWNTLEEFGITPVKILTPKREKLLKSRIRGNGVDNILIAIGNIRNSAFLQGQNNRAWMIYFTWFLKPENFAKVFEGQYSNKSAGKPQSYMEKIQNRVSEVDNWV